ncbi:DMT family transporter [Lacicoccus alkaliphilus]|uniref:EamA domain-containing membrane protein RarD n=1 Tax=Lacicoccus alkaliphilus DSM 16010 TaxID=1123231 RepID=A0A1M7ARU0_9BACL|nr:DMT family transporter [Salinicoccus alkaliphilus]SHL45326.1 EamA domain-containing membrane protein RarD [Salinicoccus alkaliphilus DSM 16010]
MKKSVLVLLAISVICIAFAAIFVKLSGAPASIISMYRMFFASLLLAPVVYKYRRELLKLTAREWGALIIAGLFLAMHFGFWFESLHLTSVASSTVILALQPIIAMVGAYLVYREKVSARVAVSVFVSFLGVVLISWGDFSLTDLSAITGNFLSFLGAVAVVCYFMIGQNAVRSLKHWVYSFLVFSIAGVFLLTYNIITNTELFEYPPGEWLLFVLLAIFPTIAHVIFNYLLYEVSPTTVSMAMLLEPVGASILAFFILSETLGPLQLVGGVIVLGGVYIFLKSQGRGKHVKT